MSEIREELVEIVTVKHEAEQVVIEVKVDKRIFMKLFGSYDFQKEVERLIAKKIVDNFPIEKLNEIQSRIDTNAVAKSVSLELIANVSGKNNRY